MKKKIYFIIIMLITCFALAACGEEKTAEKVTDQYEMTPLIDQDGADPWVFRQDGMYYYTKRTGNTVTLFRSENLSDVASGERMDVLEENSELEQFWAPELHKLDGVWYIYFAACTYDSDIHTMYVLSNENEDPFEGEWALSAMKGMDDKFAIDGTVLDAGGERYFIWSGWEGYENVQQNLYISRMVSPVETRAEKVLISQPDYEWEQNGTPLVNEGPQPIVIDGMVNLVYSASGSWTNDYCLGILTAEEDSNLCDPSSWTKSEEPVLESGNDVYGPGHNCFATSPDGKDIYIIYHAARWDGAGWSRSVRMQPVNFGDDGVLDSLKPAESQDTVPVPGGEPGRIRSLVKDLELSGGVEKTEDETALSGCAVTGFDESRESANWSVEVPENGLYMISVYAKIQNIVGEEDFAYAYIMANGSENEIKMSPSAYYQPLSFRQELDKGKNTISVSFEAMGGDVSLDRIELMPTG